MKLIQALFFTAVLFSSVASAASFEVYTKDVSKEHYQFYLKAIEPTDRPFVMIHGEVVIPVPIGPGTPERDRTNILRVWKEGSQWKTERFNYKNKLLYDEFLKQKNNNLVPTSGYSTYQNGQLISLSIGTYRFTINGYKSNPTVSQVEGAVSSGLINGYFAYPFSSYTQSEQAVDLESYVTDTGQAALSLAIDYADKRARVSFVENGYQINGLNELKSHPSVTYSTKDKLTTIKVEHDDKWVTYFLNHQTWVDYNSGVKNPLTGGWRKAPYQADYLSQIGLCEQLKNEATPSCSPVVKLDYGRVANPDSFPYLAGWSDSDKKVVHQYQHIASAHAVTKTETTYLSSGTNLQGGSSYLYSTDAKGNPVSLREESIKNPITGARQVTRFVTRGDYSGLAHQVVRYGMIDNREQLLSDTSIDWHLASDGKAQKGKTTELVYGSGGSLTQTTTVDNSYDAKDRLERRLTITENTQGEQVEEEVEYRYQDDFVAGKTERRSIISPAYENGVSEQIVKEFDYVYQGDNLVEQITRQGGFETREVVSQDSQGRVITRHRTVNGETVLQETITYQADKVTQRCENGTCIDYQYQATADGRVEIASFNGVPFNETHFDNNDRLISKTVRGVTQKTQYYAVSDVPAQLQEWLSVCPSDTTNVVYQSRPESMMCITSRGQFTLQKGLDDRFIISGEISDEHGKKQVIVPHFEGESETNLSVTTQLEQQNVEYEINGQAQQRLEVTPNLTESYDKWGNVVRRYYDITGLLYQVDDHLGNTVRFTYNASGKQTSSELNNNPETRIVHQYDARGLRVATIDPIRGHWQYHYNLNKQLAWQQDANGDRSDFSYDAQNRIKQLTTPYNTTCYEYPSQLPLEEPTRVVQVAGKQESCEGHQVEYEENNTYQWPNGWLIQRDITLEDGRVQTTHYTHDANGNVKTESSQSILGNDFSIELAFKNGMPYQWSNAQTGEVYKEIKAVDAQQKPLHVRYGNGLEEFYQYDATSGQVTKEWAMRQGQLVYDFDYLYDENDLLINRKRHFYYRNRSETSFEDEYGYDESHRLTSHSLKQFCINNVCQDVAFANAIEASAEYRYDEYGNIKYKTGVGDYFYEAQDPYRLTRIEEENGETRVFDYDANGNLLFDQRRNFSYENNRLVKVERSNDISSNGVVDRDQTRFTYGPNGQQIVRTDKRFDPYALEWKVQTTYSAGAYSYLLDEEQNLTQETFGGNGFAISCQTSGCETTYVHNDRLGQQIMSTSDAGDIVSQTFTDPFGATHNILLPEAHSAVAISPTYSSSFGHTGIAGFDLIHMRGRVYDPFLGRFVQADPFVLGKENLVSYNRYAFKLNNPVNAIDPSGYWGFVKRAVKSVSRGFKKVGKELSRAESRIRAEAKRAESRARAEAKRVEARIRAEAKRVESQMRNEVKRVESRVRNEAKRVESQIRNESKRFERRTRHEVGRWESDVRMTVKVIHTMVKENPEVAIAMAVGMWLCPASASYFINTVGMNSFVAWVSAGAITGAATHLIANKGDLKGIEKSILSGAVTAGVANGVAHGIMETSTMVQLAKDYQYLASGIKIALKSVGMAAGDNLIYGRDFSDALIAGVLRNIANDVIDSNMQSFNVAAQMTVSAVAGGIITTEVYGGSFSQNFAQGAFNSLVDYSANALGDVFSGLSFAEAVELVMDFIPGVSNLNAGIEFATGETLFSGHKFGDTERALVGTSIILGPVGKAGIKAGKLATAVVKSSDEAADLFGASSQLSKADNLVSGGGAKGLKGNKDFKAALSQFKNTPFTNAGRAVTKHPEYFGFKNTNELRKVYNSEAKINELAADTLKDIMRTGKTTTGSGGRYPDGWKTITAPDGRAASWHADGRFIGFRGVQ
ncbi:RHS repeat-associated core domain-containing protein [Vibrio caribbeanicus]|uniref:RHS repeat-associated core domain-containing protein n=1 Tax=Vibrio caribbeanicus TaxID=701175 RepID=UPI0030D7B6FC